MDVFIEVEGVNYGFIEIWEGMGEKEFMQKVREITGMKDLEMKEDLDLRLVVQDEVINFSLPSRILSKRYLEKIRKYDIEKFVENEDPDLLGTFLDVFDINDITYNEGYSSLMYSSVRGNTEMVKLLIERGANLEIKDKIYNFSALNIACINGHVEIAKLLIEGGANKESKDFEDMTPLNNASLNGYIELIDLLNDGKGEKVFKNTVKILIILDDDTMRKYKWGVINSKFILVNK